MRSWIHTTAPAPSRPLPASHAASTYHPDEQASSDRYMRRSRSAEFCTGYDEDGSGSSDDDAEIPLADLDPDLDTNRLLQPPPRCVRRVPQHRVRIQDHLASVRSMSIVNRQSSPTSTATSGLSFPSTRSDIGADGGRRDSDLGSNARANRIQRSRSAIARCMSTVAATSRSDGRRSRRSLEEEDNERNVKAQERDMQLRGYGIGGAGNIRKSDLKILGFSEVVPHCVHFTLTSDLTNWRLLVVPGRATDVIGASTRPLTFNTLLSRSSSAPNSPLPAQNTSDWRKWNLGDYFSRLSDRKAKSKGTTANRCSVSS